MPDSLFALNTAVFGFLAIHFIATGRSVSVIAAVMRAIANL